MERDYYNGLNFHLEHIYKLENECNRLEKSNIHFKKIAYNNRVTNSDKSKELQRQLDIIEDKIKTQELENNRIIQQRDGLEKTLFKEKQKTAALDKDLKNCKEYLQKYNVERAKLQKWVQELDGMKEKTT